MHVIVGRLSQTCANPGALSLLEEGRSSVKSFASLIRLHQWQLDEKRRALAELQTLADRLEGEIQRLDAEIAAEREVAERDPGSSPGFGLYVKSALNRRERLKQSVRQVETQIAAAREEIAEAFQDLKKFELAQEDRDRRAALRRRRIETIALDEKIGRAHV